MAEITTAERDARLREAILDGTPTDVVERYMRLPDLATETDFGEYDENVVVIDTETTGVSFKKDELTQIAAARLEHGEVTAWYVTFVNPGMPIPEEITHLTHISDEDVADAPTPTEALTDLVEFVGDAKLVAHNASFDKTFVTRHPAGYPLLENQWIDSLELSRIALPRMRSHRLIDLVVAFGAPLSTHRADDDVVATCALYRILLAGIESIPAELLCEIASYADPEHWPFGEIFKFFAARTNTNTNAASFSLARMRRERVAALVDSFVPRRDAATLLTSTQEEALEHSVVSIKREDGSPLQKMSYPSDSQIEEAFSDTGLLGNIYGDFEQRAEQLEMACAVKDAYEQSTNLVVEAGTGTGKSMAYLVPSALTALENGIGVGIATKTNALLDQLVYKELPALSRGLQDTGLADRPLNYVPIKGFTHYPCLLRIQRIQQDGPRMRLVANEEKSQAPALAALLSYIEQTSYDDMDALKIDYRVLPRGVITTNSSECLRQRCPFFGKECFVFGRRQQAECADVVVTNHSLLFYDAVLDNALLPPIRYWVVDEAHSVEEDARNALSITLSLDELTRISRKLVADDVKTNVLKAAKRALDDGSTPLEALATKGEATAQEFEESLAEFGAATRGLLYFDTQKKSSYDLFDVWINDQVRASQPFAKVAEVAMVMVGRMEKLIGILQDMVSLLDDEQGAQSAQRALATTVLELKEATVAADKMFAHPSDVYVYSVTLNRHEAKGKNRAGGNAFHAELYNVGTALDETFYDNTRSVVYTSATLTVDGKFSSFENAVGLNESEQSSAATLKLDPCFDFDNNMQIYVISDMPEPNNPAYLEKLQAFLKEAHVSQGGSMLTLFTNKRDMDRCFDEVSTHLKEYDLRLVSQRRGVSVKGIRDEFVKNEALSLFALKSFWEGFDAPGATLKSVVVPRLPFSNPNDPLSLERNSRDDNAWMRFDLPRAVIDLRQAAGRLIRKANDHGAFILCDSRLLTKRYGRLFISSLPSTNVKVLSAADVCRELQR